MLLWSTNSGLFGISYTVHIGVQILEACIGLRRLTATCNFKGFSSTLDLWTKIQRFSECVACFFRGHEMMDAGSPATPSATCTVSAVQLGRGTCFALFAWVPDPCQTLPRTRRLRHWELGAFASIYQKVFTILIIMSNSERDLISVLRLSTTCDF